MLKKKRSFMNKVVLITGGCSGIGKLMATKLFNKGARVVVWDINDEAIAATKNERKCYVYKCDVTNRDEVFSVADQVRREVGDVDVLINNAGIVTGKKILETNPSSIQRTFNVNSISHFWTVQAFLPHMLEKNWGHITTIASTAGLSGIACLVDYCASKFAAVGFDEGLRREIQLAGKSGVKTTCICPYLIDTGMFKGTDSSVGIWKLLANELPPNYVAEQVIHAMATEEERIILPYRLGSVEVLKLVLPWSVQDWLATKYVGMDKFVGRH